MTGRGSVVGPRAAPDWMDWRRRGGPGGATLWLLTCSYGPTCTG